MNYLCLLTAGITFMPKRFVEMLPKMGIGMLIIFIIIAVIICITLLVNKLFKQK